tara:strand:+ start:631 stop:816 length:186 start_codon:yes stop_codon:yes gene_type:complete
MAVLASKLTPDKRYILLFRQEGLDAVMRRRTVSCAWLATADVAHGPFQTFAKPLSDAVQLP